MLFYLLLPLLVQIGALKHPRVKATNSNRTTVFSEAAVVTNSEICTNIALEVLSEEGSAADAAIAALLCEGITNPQSMGIGGGFLLTIYTAATKSVEVLNARECAPAAASENMFGPISEKDTASGGLSVAVPGELKGYWALHNKYGRMSWIDLFRPAIELCKTGVAVTSYTSKIIEKVKDEIMVSPSIKKLLTNPQTGQLYKEGELMERPELGETLDLVAKHGPDVLYHGNLTEDFLYDIKDNGGIITAEDLKEYKVRWETPFEQDIGDYAVHTVPTPGSGPLLMMVLEVMAKKMCDRDSLFWHRLIETWKFAYGVRSHLSGPKNGEKPEDVSLNICIENVLQKIKDCGVHKSAKEYMLKGKVPEDHGTSHISVLAPNGDAVSVTSTINLSFGALFVSDSTGIILNNEMIDFSIPNHYMFRSNAANLIAPHRQPMSTMVPTIVTNRDTGELRLVIGAAGGFKILTSTSIVMIEHLFMDASLEEAIANKRLHHQLKPMVLEYEEGFSDDILNSLQQRGHRLQQLDNICKLSSNGSMAMHSCVNAIAIVAGEIHAVADFRRLGYAGGY